MPLQILGQLGVDYAHPIYNLHYYLSPPPQGFQTFRWLYHVYSSNQIKNLAEQKIVMKNKIQHLNR